MVKSNYHRVDVIGSNSTLSIKRILNYLWVSSDNKWYMEWVTASSVYLVFLNFLFSLQGPLTMENPLMTHILPNGRCEGDLYISVNLHQMPGHPGEIWSKFLVF